MDLFFKTVTWAGSALILFPLALLVAGMLFLKGRGADGLLVSGGLLGAFVLTHGIKRLVARPRPDVQDLLVAMPSDFSFPSAHSAQVAAFTLACAMVAGRDGPTAAALLIWGGLGLAAIFVWISRIYLHVHYPSDVAAGAVLGAVWVLALNLLLKWFSARI